MSTEIKKSTLQQVAETYVKAVSSNFAESSLSMDEYSKKCVLLAINKMNDVLKENGKSWKEVNASSVTACLTSIATLKLNLSAYPAEAYIVLRGNNLSFAPQGEGYRTLVQRFGRGVKDVAEPWLVKEGDSFTYPSFDGENMTPPKWTMTGKGKVIRIIYRVKMIDGTNQYLISEREDVKNNLLAHLKQNLVIGKKDYKTYDAILKKSENETLDQLLKEPEVLANCSPSWKAPSTEAMIIRKMKNNALKNFPKDFDSALAQEAFSNAKEEDLVAEETEHGEYSVKTETLNDPIEDTPIPTVEAPKPHVPDLVQKKPQPVKKEEAKKDPSEDDMPF
mgnify:FL=1